MPKALRLRGRLPSFLFQDYGLPAAAMSAAANVIAWAPADSAPVAAVQGVAASSCSSCCCAAAEGAACSSSQARIANLITADAERS
jgi:hypothetical protein